MSDPFMFQDATPAKEAPAKSPAPTPTHAIPTKRRRGPNKPKDADQAPPLRVDLLHAIKAAAILDETDANAFAAIVKVLNACPAAQRNRIARALVTVFG